MIDICKLPKMYFLVMILIGLTTVSCSEDFLDVKPQQAVPADGALETIGDFEAAIAGVYDGLSSSNYYGRYFVLVSDIMSDDVKQNASANRASDWAAYAGSSTDNNNLALNVWNAGYKVIDRANRIIHAEVELPASVQDEYGNIRGQAYAARALAHFDMVRIYAQHYTYSQDASHPGVPIITEFDPDQKPARNSVKEVYDQVISDFQASLGLIGENNNSFYLSESAVHGLLSRVYLYKEDWANAKEAATEVISSGKYDLVDHDNYATIFTGDHSPETLFEIDMNPTDNRGSNAIGGMYLESGYGDYLPTKDLLNLIPGEDARQAMFSVDEDLAGDYASHRVAKYSSPLGEDNTPVIRLSEVYLNRAEANYHLNQTEAAQDDLDAIRQRGLPSADDVTATGSELLEEILKERRIELSFEGHRLYDLTRNKKGVIREDCTAPENACTVTYPNDRFVLAIGQYETDVNPNIVQNPGYGN